MAAGGVNKAILIGVVSRGPEIRTTKAGVPQAVFGLETSEIWFDKETNEKREKTISHRVVVYGPLVKVVGKHLRKGARAFVEGMIETRRWANKGQPETWTTEIVVQGWSGQLTILDFVNGEPAGKTETDADESASAPTPLSITRSVAKYGDGTTDDPDTAGLERFLSTPDDADLRRRREQSDPDRRAS